MAAASKKAHILAPLSRPWPYPPVLILSFKTEETLKVTTFLSCNMRSSPVAGFLPLRLFLLFTQNFPNPEISTSSPLSRVPLMISRMPSTSSTDFFLVKPILAVLSIRSAFVSVIISPSYQIINKAFSRSLDQKPSSHSRKREFFHHSRILDVYQTLFSNNGNMKDEQIEGERHQ